VSSAALAIVHRRFWRYGRSGGLAIRFLADNADSGKSLVGRLRGATGVVLSARPTTRSPLGFGCVFNRVVEAMKAHLMGTALFAVVIMCSRANGACWETHVRVKDLLECHVSNAVAVALNGGVSKAEARVLKTFCHVETDGPSYGVGIDGTVHIFSGQ
jgi:hypothetical protein